MVATPPDAPGDHENGAAESTEEALARARSHAFAAAGESVAAIHALLDAAALAASGEPSQLHPVLGPLAKVLADLESRLEHHDSGTRITQAIAEALDVEIARWEQRAEEDPEARAVLRAFLGLRELLWEFGVRRRNETSRSGRRGDRVQRVPVES